MRLVFQWLLLLVATYTTRVPSAPNKTPRLSPFPRDANTILSPISNELETFFYPQTLDHFNYKSESYATFHQRYFVNSKWWGGGNKSAPILAYLGAEAPLEGDLKAVGFLNENAPHFKALVVYLEHRFYGESNPLGSMAKSVKHKNVRGYFSSAQALADYAEILVHLKKRLRAHHSPIIVIGGSYGGMLASWFRLKYPHIALGALASSAPILYFDNLTPQDGYYSIVTKDFKDVSENCYTTIKKSWDEIDEIASSQNGLLTLSKKFKTCKPLEGSDELKTYLRTQYASAAQYNAPPTYPTTQICRGVDGASNTTDILDRVFAGLVAYLPNKPCYDITPEATQTSIGWGWQTCSELLIPMFITDDLSMFPISPYNEDEVIDYCTNQYGVKPRPHWVTTYYGGQDIKLVLSKFGSNIIFSNGLKDPYSVGGVLEDISDSILAVYAINGSHCLDISKSTRTDPEWLIMQRKDEVKIIKRWFKKYYHDLRSLTK